MGAGLVALGLAAMVFNLPWSWSMTPGAMCLSAGAALGLSRIARDRTFVIGRKSDA